MASAWPSLRHLIINNREITEPNVTLYGFSDLLLRCPQLEILYISVYVSANAAMAVGVVPNRSIHTLSVGYSVVEEEVDPVKLAKVVSGICPNLHNFHVSPIGCEPWDVLRNETLKRRKKVGTDRDTDWCTCRVSYLFISPVC
jgi:hypothetical protein